MQLSKIRIRNYRLLIDAELEVDPKTTLIVGRNNTAKTSCFVCIGNVLEGENISFNDYPLLKREDFYTKIALFMEKKLSYEDLCKQVEVISIDFLVDYSLDDPDDNLGALSPFIIDVDVDTTTALIRAEYRLKTDEKTLWALLESSYYKDGAFAPNEEAHDVLADNFGAVITIPNIAQKLLLFFSVSAYYCRFLSSYVLPSGFWRTFLAHNRIFGRFVAALSTIGEVRAFRFRSML